MASVPLERPIFFVEFSRRCIPSGRPQKGIMRARRVCCISLFWGRFLRPMVWGILAGTAVAVSAQTAAPSSSSSESLDQTYVADASLPDAPQPQTQPQTGNQMEKPLVAAVPKTVPATTNLPMAPMYSRVIPAGEATPQIHKWDKITLATRDLYSVTSFADFFVSAGWQQLRNSQPNYGTDRGAFGERLGAAAIRDSSQAFLTNGLFAVWLHQDPRYFALGRGHSLGRRTWYALTRPLITRDSSDGHAVFNSSLILGQAAGTALTNLYYPQSNRNFHDNISGFGSSIGGSALSFVLDEYTSEILKAVHLRGN
jgi:hypothetical protein